MKIKVIMTDKAMDRETMDQREPPCQRACPYPWTV